jgi:TolB-like protein/Flp pilus assembly protein TadD
MPLHNTIDRTVSLRLALLGEFAATDGAGKKIAILAKKSRALLAILALSSSGSATRDRLAGILWGDRADEQARSSLRQALAVLRKELGNISPLPLSVDSERIAIDRTLVWADVIEFQQLALSDETADLKSASQLYRGELLADTVIRDLAFEDWLASGRQQLADLAIGVLERLFFKETGAARVDIAKRLVALDPLREASHRALMDAYAAYGQRDQAIRQYEACRQILRRELQIEPSKETKGLHKDIDEGRYKPSAPEQATEVVAQPLLAAPNKPSLAVLPFENRSDDPKQGYFADGITEDIITELSRRRSLFVIAQNSSFQYRNKPFDVRQIGQELCVRYVVEGSVRKMGNRLRITAQLIEALTGNHLWSERYDRSIEDLFELQDEVTRTIVATLIGRVEDAEIKESVRKHPENLAAYDSLLRGIEHLRAYGQDENRRARELFQHAISLDPRFALAHAYFSLALLIEHGFDRTPDAIKAWAVESAREGVRLDPLESRCHQFLGQAYLLRGEYDLALAHFERTTALNPNDANAAAHIGCALAIVGRAEEGIGMIRHAMRLNPFHPDWYWDNLATAQYTARRYEEALDSNRQSGGRASFRCIARMAACYAQLGQLDEARERAAEVLRMKPNFHLLSQTLHHKNPADAEHWLEGMRKAGLPE